MEPCGAAPDRSVGLAARPGRGYPHGMSAVAVISIVSSAITVVVVMAGFFWAARADGRYQKEHDQMTSPRGLRTRSLRAPHTSTRHDRNRPTRPRPGQRTPRGRRTHLGSITRPTRSNSRGSPKPCPAWDGTEDRPRNKIAECPRAGQAGLEPATPRLWRPISVLRSVARRQPLPRQI